MWVFLLLTVAHGFILLTRSVILSVFSAHPAMPFINVNYWTRRFLRSLTILEERTLWEPYNKHWKYYRTQENKQHVQYFSSQVSRICTVTYFLHRTYYVFVITLIDFAIQTFCKTNFILLISTNHMLC